MKTLNQRGNVLLFAVVAVTAISVLGTGIYFMTNTAIFSGLDANAQNRAYQLAVAGRDYALAKNLTTTDSGDYKMSNGDIFRLAINVNSATSIYTITSTGIVGLETPYETKRTITIKKRSQGDLSFAKDIASFTSGIRQSLAGFVDVNPTAATISLGQLGSTQPRQFGSVWYSGSAAQGNCQNGKCEFGRGFRAYFIFKLERESLETPQGFTFAVFNGTDNSNTSAGGEITMPELLAYAGNSCKGRDLSGNCTGGYVDPNPVISQKGIQPPKMAIEFDSRRNNNGSVDFCNTNSRADGTRNHMAYTFWGSNDSTAAKCTGRDSSLTYDDNRHGAGGGSYPINAVASDTSDTSDYFTGYSTSWNPNWLFGTSVPAYAFRIEVQRGLSKNAGNKYEYTIMAWIKNDCADIVCSNHANTSFDNTKSAYPDAVPLDPPVLTRMIELDQSSHDKFNTFLFGWTAAAGSASREKVTYDKFQIYFLK